MNYLALAMCLFTLHAQAPIAAANPFLGSWKRKYQEQGDGLMLHTIVTINPNGAGFTFSAGRYDGKEYPVYVPRTLGVFLNTGTKPARTAAFVRKDANTVRRTDRVNGWTSSTGVNQVSEDGRTMTETVKSFDQQGKQTSTSVVVFDKQ
jgi:hypothetical protein